MNKAKKAKLLSGLDASPRQIDRELRSFDRAARVLSAAWPRLIDEHPRQWVGVHDGKVAASAKTLNALFAKLKRKGVAPSEAIVRYISTDERRLIL